ncbi:membrane fusion protein (multidrug efflux system) [Sphingobacterium paludis]|uniref:Membrane fusion protein (Multidrug efflux system) n=2 Tax=Sphingobacterium paludis TaxID=1476465 RepID=A0A4R7CZ15_9SPHI|nr:membrane fusion protein (multidrug efflux system) [Sphingobacterium paludis]
MTILLIFSACKGGDKEQKKDEQPATHAVLNIQPQETVVYTSYPASIQGQDVIEIRPRVEGYLEELYVDEGATVKKGQRLFRISSPQFEQEKRMAQAAIQTAQADVDAAEMMVRKTRPLVEKEIISEYELESADYALQAKKAALAQARANLANAQANLGFTIISSPSDGIIGTIPYRKGSLVSTSSTSPLTFLSSNKDMYAYFSLDEKQLLAFNRQFEGKTIQEKLKNLPAVELILADGSSYEQQGQVQTASGLLTAQTGSANFRATFPNPSAVLQSGGSAILRIPRKIDHAIIIPQSCTYEVQDKRMVYVIHKDNRVRSQAIVATATNDGKHFIVEKGLSEGDAVVLSGMANLKDSVLITPKETPQKR